MTNGSSILFHPFILAQYNLERLKLMCEECLCNELNAENAADTLILADMHCAERLKEITIEYINRRVKYITVELPTCTYIVVRVQCLHVFVQYLSWLCH